MYNHNLTKNYFKHLFKARNEHSLHSPFIFDLYTKAIKGKSEDSNFDDIETLRKLSLKNTEAIEVTDFGAGSKKLKSNRRTVSSIARNSLSPQNQCLLLHRILTYLNVQTTIELGTSLGISSLYLSRANNSNNQVITIEGCPNILQLAQNNFDKLKASNIRGLNGNIDQLLGGILQTHTPIDAIFIDGNHSLEATIRYFKMALPYLHDNSILIFDDIYWSEGMESAWQQIFNDPAVTLSIDLFEFGIVFFRPNQPKQHFKLKW